MRISLRPHHFLLALLLCALPLQAHATGADIREMFEGLVFAFMPLFAVVAILVLVVCGFTLVTATDEGKLEKARATIIAVMIGGMLTMIVYILGSTNFVGMMYQGTAATGLTVFLFGGYASNPIAIQAAGVADWLVVISVMLGMVFIIIAGLRAVSSLGDEGKYQSVRNAVIQAVIGVIVIGAAYIFRTVFYDVRDPDPLITYFSVRIIIVLGILTLIAVAILVYAGFRMIISFGDESAYEAAKSLAIRAAVGILIVILSFALVYIVANIFGP